MCISCDYVNMRLKKIEGWELGLDFCNIWQYFCWTGRVVATRCLPFCAREGGCNVYQGGLDLDCGTLYARYIWSTMSTPTMSNGTHHRSKDTFARAHTRPSARATIGYLVYNDCG